MKGTKEPDMDYQFNLAWPWLTAFKDLTIIKSKLDYLSFKTAIRTVNRRFSIGIFVRTPERNIGGRRPSQL